MTIITQCWWQCSEEVLRDFEAEVKRQRPIIEPQQVLSPVVEWIGLAPIGEIPLRLRVTP